MPLLDLGHKEIKNAAKKNANKKYEPYLKEVQAFLMVHRNE
jgi:hypothetical protein